MKSRIKLLMQSISFWGCIFSLLRRIKRVSLEWFYIFILKHRYRKLLRNFCFIGKRKIRVLFPLSNTSKWKVQSLYDLMNNSDQYEPIVVITLMDIENDLSLSQRASHIEGVKKFLEKRGCRYVVGYDCQKNVFIPFSEFSPDLVWYTQPWRISKCQSPLDVSRYALTCYTPYYLQNYGGLDVDCDIFFMRSLWRNFAMNEAWAVVCNRYQGGRRAGESVGLGHPMLDQFSSGHENREEKKYIIYAPHWSCNTGECFSTFLENGKKMLAFAKDHLKQTWVFKPHPTLRYILVNVVGWSEVQVDKYYSEWENIGIGCYTGDYVDLFNKSKVMITDCASFLVEYPCTKMPIIHLVSSNSKYPVHPISQKLFSSYYQAHTWDEFVEHFSQVVIKGDDYKCEERLREVKRMRLLNCNAAGNIIQYLDSVLREDRL